ncbi:hypothetical protein [Mucilaginibacter terrae]|uniref:Uncharacterized protein n=1 Tax=Mucilaginibacter terrae TaxID=1955052 RepID=A0ABU3GZ51_9SPHI|nr:hypothetical protein [Mucilaginibacter terrae]MDT3404257.1 hypothetical protein [Mucilaginibacter terrae]
MAKVKTLNSVHLISPEQALEQIFGTIASAEVKAELQKWYAFGLTGDGRELHKLPPEQLGLFIHKLQDLSLALYAQQQEVQKGGDHEQ